MMQFFGFIFPGSDKIIYWEDRLLNNQPVINSGEYRPDD